MILFAALNSEKNCNLIFEGTLDWVQPHVISCIPTAHQIKAYYIIGNR